jgi:outer membrane protein assembly factor BamE (lipoprotein component of BamABCDE complex)
MATKLIAILALAAISLLAACAGGLRSSAAPPRSDEQFAHIQRGWTKDDVQRLVGPPDETMGFPLSHTEAWDYRYQDSWGYIAIFSVTFGGDGRAQSTLSTRVNSGGDLP